MRAVLFDCFGVIARTQTPAAMAAIARTAQVADHARFWEAYWLERPDYDRGVVTSDEFWARVGGRVGRAFSEADFAALLTADNDSWLSVDEDAVAYLHELSSSGMRLGLLSNIPPPIAAIYERRPWMEHFSAVAWSCRIGYAKPQTEAFTWVLERLGVPAAEVLFVDDSAENVAAAESLGMQGHRFLGLEQLRPVVSGLLPG